MRYRKEVDGLRCVAVLPVILYHAGFSIFSGGFVGVDIFFVISGYLITTILINELDRGNFSIIEFYERRARRILPALFLVMLACIPFAWFWMLPDQLADFSQSVVAVSLFVSNILFWRESGYFAVAAGEKPLLHTWSLAVEEQYYVLFPIFLSLTWRFGRNRVFWTIILFAAISLIASDWVWRRNPTADFYLTPTRAWELLAGSIAAFLALQNGVRCNHLISLAGLVAIAVAILMYDENTPFPSFYTILPVVGVLLIILYGGDGSAAARILGNRVLVFIGKISYSAYLWHQPIFAFARVRLHGEPSGNMMLGLTAISLVLAIFSCRYVERPFRASRSLFWTRRKIFTASAAGMTAFITSGLYVALNKGFDDRLTASQRLVVRYMNYKRVAYYREGTCFLRPEQSYESFDPKCFSGSKVLIWGDSHAAALSYGLRQIYGPIGQMTAPACPPLMGVYINSRPNCQKINNYVLKTISKIKPDVVILHANWLENKNIIHDGLIDTVRFLRNGGFSHIIVVGGVPQYHPSLPERLLSSRIDLLRPTRLKADLAGVESADILVKNAALASGALFVDILGTLCQKDACIASIKSGNAVVPLAWDYAHLTAAGSIYIASRAFDGLLNRPVRAPGHADPDDHGPVFRSDAAQRPDLIARRWST